MSHFGQKLLSIIHSHIAEFGVGPNVRHIRERLGCSPHNVIVHLKKLEKQNIIELEGATVVSIIRDDLFPRRRFN